MAKIIKRRKVYHDLVRDESDESFRLPEDFQSPNSVNPPLQPIVDAPPAQPTIQRLPESHGEYNKPTILQVNSLLRTTTVDSSDSDFFYRIDLPPNHEYNRVVVMGGLFPRSWYSIQQQQNTMTLIEGKTSTTITVTPASYNINTFMAEILNGTNGLNTLSPNHFTYAMTFVSNTNTWNFTVNSGAVAVEFVFGVFLNNALGFDENTTNAFTVGGVPNTMISTGIVNLNSSPPPLFYIKSDMVDNEDFNYPGLLEVVPVPGPPWSYTAYTCPDSHGYARKMRPTKSAVFHFQITDHLNNVFNLNQQNVLFTLKCFRDTDAGSSDKFLVND